MNETMRENVKQFENEKRLSRLNADLVDLVNDMESARWKASRTTAEKITFIQRFWNVKDLTPATPANVFFPARRQQRDANEETSYEIQYEMKAPERKGLLAGLNPFGKSGGSISVSETRRGRAATEPTYLQLDFSQLRGGKYDLTVRVTDKLAKIAKEGKLAFELE